MEKADVERIEPPETRRKMQAGQAILVCAYEADEKFREMNLEGAKSLNEFKAALPSIPKNQEIVFYCA